MAKDAVREVLEKDPKERTDEDIDVLFEFMQSFPVCSSEIFLIFENVLILGISISYPLLRRRQSKL